MKNIALITPCKNEEKNIPKLFDAIVNMHTTIKRWIIIDDQSTDSSAKIIKELIKEVKNVISYDIIQTQGLTEEYALGEKYSAVVKTGIDYLFETEGNIDCYDFIGILDADSFPQPNYYQNLIQKFNMLPKLGIASGKPVYLIGDTKQSFKVTDRWPLGSARLIRTDCFKNIGYQICTSADSILVAKAWLNGWQCQSFEDSIVVQREVGNKFNFKYYGTSAYKRYVPYYLILMRCLFNAIRGRFKLALTFHQGFLESKKKGERSNIDMSVKSYYRYLLVRIFLESLIVKINKIKIKYSN